MLWKLLSRQAIFSVPEERAPNGARASGKEKKSPFRLTNAVIYLHAVFFLIPWRSVHYFPAQLTPYRVLMILSAILCAAWAMELMLFGARRPKLGFGAAVFWFWVIFWGGILKGYIDDDPIKTHVPIYRLLAWSVPYVDGMLVWHLIQSNGWGRAEFERALKCVFWVALVLSIENILVYYLGAPVSYSMQRESGVQIFMSMFTQSKAIVSRLGLLLTGVSFYFFLREKRHFYLFASLSGMLMVFSTGSRVVLFSLFAGVLLALVFFMKFRKRAKFASLYAFCLAPLLFALLVSAGLAVATASRAHFIDLSNLYRGVLLRSYQYVRAVDVFLERPFLGGGPWLGYMYMYSRDTPPVFSEHVFGDFTHDNLGELIGWTGWAHYDWFQKNPMAGKLRESYQGFQERNNLHHLHNLPLQVIADLGLLGLVLLMSMLATGAIYFFRFMLLRRRKILPGAVMPFAAIFSTVVAVFISTLSVALFYPFWLFAILLCFTRHLHREAVKAHSPAASPPGPAEIARGR